MFGTFEVTEIRIIWSIAGKFLASKLLTFFFIYRNLFSFGIAFVIHIWTYNWMRNFILLTGQHTAMQIQTNWNEQKNAFDLENLRRVKFPPMGVASLDSFISKEGRGVGTRAENTVLCFRTCEEPEKPGRLTNVLQNIHQTIFLNFLN